ncbi:hypothetical protein HC028_10135 [Planosporangium flavigriseum]|uniref:SurA N-terminal domain-containing protein n=1 Tax=Planosporangium flavigriseum TaxID=373681 RepID=A0A8J3LT31_9ACTN|nr:hypothetical protein [Planosporangium flavigriseum]NJC64858.1 hypothetical protein [Planosporangium flavigriseum]GIG72730.1 hypothetical protein Pfl04_11340 [Planosporangium flavigriseum]
MQRARRVASIAGLALVGTLALTGCRSEPGAAIYVGSTTYSHEYVDGLSAQLQKVSSLSRGDGRQTIAQWLVVRDLGKRMVADNKWPAPEVDEHGAESQIQQALPTAERGSLETLRPLIKIFAEYEAYRGAVQQHATLAQPTDADYADLYQRAKVAGLVGPGVDEATYRKSLGAQNDQLFRANVSLRQLYSEAVKKANVSVNPKYAPAELALLRDQQNHALVVVSLNSKAGQPVVVQAPAEQNQDLSNG